MTLVRNTISSSHPHDPYSEFLASRLRASLGEFTDSDDHSVPGKDGVPGHYHLTLNRAGDHLYVQFDVEIQNQALNARLAPLDLHPEDAGIPLPLTFRFASEAVFQSGNWQKLTAGEEVAFTLTEEGQRAARKGMEHSMRIVQRLIRSQFEERLGSNEGIRISPTRGGEPVSKLPARYIGTKHKMRLEGPAQSMTLEFDIEIESFAPLLQSDDFPLSPDVSPLSWHAKRLEQLEQRAWEQLREGNIKNPELFTRTLDGQRNALFVAIFLEVASFPNKILQHQDIEVATTLYIGELNRARPIIEEAARLSEAHVRLRPPRYQRVLDYIDEAITLFRK